MGPDKLVGAKMHITHERQKMHENGELCVHARIRVQAHDHSLFRGNSSTQCAFLSI